MSPVPERARPRAATTLLALLVVAGAWLSLQGVGLGRTPFHTRGEPREAVVVQDLVGNRNWILPRRNGTALPRKPPLFYWLGGAVAQVRGRVDEAGVRLPSALQSGAAALLLTAVAAAVFAPLAGAASGLALLTSFEWLRAGTAARVDMTLAFGLTLVFAGLLLFRRTPRTRWLVLMYTGAAWATLAKGIPGLAIPVLQVGLLCLVDRSPALLRSLRPLRGIGVVLLIVGAWYAAAAAQGGQEFLRIVANENLVRIVGAQKAALGHAHGVGYLVGVLLLGLLPWTLLLPALGATLWRVRGNLDRRDARLFALLWIVAVLAPYAVASSKRGVYLLPLYPAVALLLGWWSERAVSGLTAMPLPRRLRALVLWPLALLFSVLALVTLSHWGGLPMLDSLPAFVRGRSAAHLREIGAAAAASGHLIAALFAVAAVAALVAALARRAAVLLPALFVCTAAVALVVRLFVLPAIGAAETRRPFVERLRAGLADPSQLHTAPGLDYGTIFYWGRALPVYDPARGGAPPPYLLLSEPAWLLAEPTLRDRFEPVPSLRATRPNRDAAPVLLRQRTELTSP